jgi:hypothetical protein
MIVHGMRVAAGGVRLPYLDERSGHRTTCRVDNTAVHDDPLAEWFPVILAGQILVERIDRAGIEDRPSPVCQACGQDERRVARGAEDCRAISGIEIGRIDPGRASGTIGRLLH